MLAYTFVFLREFLQAILYVVPILVMLGLTIIALGEIVGRIEGWNRFDAAYWAFITALTVGYGDIRPLRRSSKALSIVIAMVGFMVTGIFVAITVEATGSAIEKHLGSHLTGSERPTESQGPVREHKKAAPESGTKNRTTSVNLS
ncbi:potassium channel family protein [Biformimicrobium ophioploci]|uniref:Potassium channel domain-containing protein n=1 Tax=Biformimicrobium ophioploci TaxID=3036711 RepID=A0ABQ6M1G6_9GAMM|nr:potassium channel family protein [Microbulbifer sp. NKW57]GMG88199.1 hypothetical protein MNKW57_25200 [Microbulbifer sp. NKW57]